MQRKSPQLLLEDRQIEAFYTNVFVQSQIQNFDELTSQLPLDLRKWVADVGGGCGYFAQALSLRYGSFVNVIDSDRKSIDSVESGNNPRVNGILGDALNPPIHGREKIVCFNLVLHHLVGGSDAQTRALQVKALSAWNKTADFAFVDEYIYDSYVAGISGRLIYEITKSKWLSSIGRLVARFVPSFRANTFGVGVRFRSHEEWLRLFEEAGFSVYRKIYGVPENTALSLRLLLIRQVRRDSFLLIKRNL